MQLTEKQLTNFFKKVNKIPGGCWLWTGATTHGYGFLGLNGKNYSAHRISYQIANGEIPPGLVLDHICKNTLCVKPDPKHLEPVTQKINVLRGNTIVAQNAAKTHCPKNHPYNFSNTIILHLKNDGLGRCCRTCRDEHNHSKTKKLAS